MKIPKPIVDKNGRRTTVFVNPFKSDKIKDRLGRIDNAAGIVHVSENPMWESERWASYTPEQVLAFFPAATEVSLFHASEINPDPVRASLTFRSQPLSVGSERSGASWNREVAADMLSDKLGGVGLAGNDESGSFVAMSFSSVVEQNSSHTDVLAAYAEVEPKLAGVAKNRRALEKEIRDQNEVTSTVAALGSDAVLSLSIDGTNEAMLRAVPYHSALRGNYGGDIYLALAKNPATPKATISALIKNHSAQFRSVNMPLLLEGLRHIKETKELDYRESEHLDFRIGHLENEIARQEANF